MRSMRVFLLIAFNALMLLEAHGFTYETDRQALFEFKSQVSEDKRVVLSSWNHSFPLCNWKGVTCGRKHQRVTRLDLGGLQLGGVISPSIGNLSFLVSLDLNEISFGGTIPQEVGNLFRLEYLDLGSNFLGGRIPFGLYNLSSLEFLSIFNNSFSGSLRTDFGNLLPKLRVVRMGRNHLTGAIPTTLPNISTLQKVTMESNYLTGSIPPSFGKVKNLQRLNLADNSLGGLSFRDLEFLGALTNCTQLETLEVYKNRLVGDLPTSVANMSTNLIYLSLQKNFIYGSIPHDIGNLIRLQKLWLSRNLLTGPLPTSLGKLIGLVELAVSHNRMSREIPSFIGNLTRLETLHLSYNSFEGIVPPSLGNCSHMLDLRIRYNKLDGTIPKEIIQIPTLVNLSMEGNSLSGSLPNDVGRLQNLVVLSIGNNNLSGQLPHTLGNCLSMEVIYLQGNSFDGIIPDISGLVGLKEVDLSNNNLSGSIPEYLANFSKLEYLNLSFNNFEGKVPMEGIFQNTTTVSIFGNNDLCGGIRGFQLKPCLPQAPPAGMKHFSRLKKVVIGVSVGITLLLLLFLALVYLRWVRKRKKNKQTNNPTSSTLEVFHEIISYGDLHNATNGFSSSNMVGSGSFGTVFKALLPTENKNVAVKVLNLQRRGAMKSFMAECESLKGIRHRNLVKLLTACSSIDFQGNKFRALIYEFMSNGSLDKWLHPEEVEEILRPSRTLTLRERLNIAIDVASVLNYLHVHCHEPIAHCDLKPSNVLLDDDLTAHVSDFGLARLLLKIDQESFFNQLSSTDVRGTIGYAAPEYGMGGQPSIHGDVYSFGVLLLEMFTGKRPTNELFGGNYTLHSYTKLALPERVLDIADESIFHSGLKVGFRIAECLTLVFEVALRCCEESPTNRLATSEVAKELISIRERFFKTIRTAKR